MLTALIWIVAILLVVFVVKALCDHGRERNQKKQEEKEARLRTYKEDLEKKRIQRQAEYDARVKEFSDKYGACDVDLCVKYNTDSIESHIYVYDKSSTPLGISGAFSKLIHPEKVSYILVICPGIVGASTIFIQFSNVALISDTGIPLISDKISS